MAAIPDRWPRHFWSQRDGVLAIAFRGSDESGDQLATINNQSGYFDAYRNFLDAALLYAADPANGVTQILVTGHSLGGVMAEWFANEYALDVSALELPISIATFGSPGTDIATPPTALAQSIVHFGHTGDQIFEHQGSVGGLLDRLSSVKGPLSKLTFRMWMRTTHASIFSNTICFFINAQRLLSQTRILASG